MEDLEYLIPEFEYQRRSILWYLCLILFAVILGAVGLFTRNYTFIGLIFVSLILIIFRGTRKPRLIKLSIGKSGITIGDRFLEYKNCKNYSIYKFDGKNYLILIPLGRFQMETRIPIKDLVEVRNKLNNLLTEVEYVESFLDTLGRLTGI